MGKGPMASSSGEREGEGWVGMASWRVGWLVGASGRGEERMREREREGNGKGGEGGEGVTQDGYHSCTHCLYSPSSSFILSLPSPSPSCEDRYRNKTTNNNSNQTHACSNAIKNARDTHCSGLGRRGNRARERMLPKRLVLDSCLHWYIIIGCCGPQLHIQIQKVDAMERRERK